MIEERKDELVKEMGKMLEEGRDNVFLMLTDILKEGTELLEVGSEELREKVFGENDKGWFAGMMSRKKQIVPQLREFFG